MQWTHLDPELLLSPPADAPLFLWLDVGLGPEAAPGWVEEEDEACMCFPICDFFFLSEDA